MYNYSFIIPHKNSQGLLQRCLDSIPDREDVQIIVVDDNSDVSKVDFSHFPGLTRKNTVCVFNEDGGGAGRARNIALSKAQGKWLVFADADDYFSDSLNAILDKYRDDDTTDMVFFNYCKITETNDIIQMPITRYISNYMSRRPFSEKVLRYSAWSPWSRMLKRELQVKNHVYFEETPFGNDLMFVLKATSFASKIEAEEQIVYYYYSPALGSITKVRSEDPKQKLIHFENRLKIWNLYNEVGYHFVHPLWGAQKGIKPDDVKSLYVKYGYNNIYIFRDAFLYSMAKVFKII